MHMLDLALASRLGASIGWTPILSVEALTVLTQKPFNCEDKLCLILAAQLDYICMIHMYIRSFSLGVAEALQAGEYS